MTSEEQSETGTPNTPQQMAQGDYDSGLTEEDVKRIPQDLVKKIEYKLHHSGPLPPASEFLKYKEALDSAPERIMGMAELEQKARIEFNNSHLDLVRADLEKNHRNKARRDWITFSLAICFLIAAFLTFNFTETDRLAIILSIISGLSGSAWLIDKFIDIYKKFKSLRDDRGE